MLLFDLNYSSYIPHNLNLVNPLKFEKSEKQRREKERRKVGR
jgi:hypothetical protein